MYSFKIILIFGYVYGNNIYNRFIDKFGCRILLSDLTSNEPTLQLHIKTRKIQNHCSHDYKYDNKQMRGKTTIFTLLGQSLLCRSKDVAG